MTDATFEAISAHALQDPDTRLGNTFQSPGLKVRGKIFAMLVRDELVFKLPAERCAELVATAGARPFEAGRRTMREWVVVPHSDDLDWLALADEARSFVRAGR